MKIYITVCYIFIMLMFSSFSYSGQVITWYIISYEPVYITEGENKGKGFGDTQLKIFIDNMPEYKHEISTANLSRIRKELQTSDKLAGTPSQGGPADRFGNNVLVSEPTVLVPPVGLVIRKEELNRFKGGADISLENDLFGNRNLRAGVIQGAAEHIHPSAPGMIEKYKTNVVTVPDPDQERFFKMLMRGRFDYFFAYPFNYQVITGRLGIQDKLLFLHFNEAAEYKKVYAFFTNTPESKIVIEKINSIIKMKQYKEKTVTALLKYVPENIRAEAAKINGLSPIDLK